MDIIELLSDIDVASIVTDFVIGSDEPDGNGPRTRYCVPINTLTSGWWTVYYDHEHKALTWNGVDASPVLALDCGDLPDGLVDTAIVLVSHGVKADMLSADTFHDQILAYYDEVTR